MYSVLAFGYEFISEFLPFILVLMLFRRNKGKYTAAISKKHYILPIVFALYIMAVFHVTGAGTIYDAMTVQFEDMKERIHLIPFSNKIDIVGYILNIVMFAPLGLLVPLLWQRMGKAPCIMLAGFSFSLLIELSQLLSYRGTDVDDLILNTLGALIGFLLYKVLDNVTKSRYQLTDLDTRELPVYIAALYLGRCLLFHQVGLINLVYGY